MIGSDISEFQLTIVESREPPTPPPEDRGKEDGERKKGGRCLKNRRIYNRANLEKDVNFSTDGSTRGPQGPFFSVRGSLRQL